MSRRTGAALLCAAVLLSFARAAAAQTQAEPDTPDVPGGPGVLTGEVVHQQATPDEGRGAGIDVLLYALPSAGTPGVRRGLTDETGAFRFEGISNDPETVYLVGARYRGVPFPGARVQFRAGQREAHTKVRISEISEDAAALHLPELEMRLEWRGSDVQVTETYRVENRGALVAHFAEDRRDGNRALFSAALPPGATDLESPFGLPLEGVARAGDTLRFFGPIYPSAWGGPFSERQEITLRYRVAAPDRDFSLRRDLPVGLERVVVDGGAGFESLEVSGAEQEELDGLRSWIVAGAALQSGLRLHARFPEAQQDPSALTRREVRVFLELDGAALTVREEHSFRVAGGAPLLAPGANDLLRFGLPPGARDLRFSPEANNWGLANNDDGILRLRGPLPAGEHQFDLAYQLPRRAPEVVYQFQSAPAVPLLSVFIADTGLMIETDRLHRRRPVRAGTRTYSFWEGFQIEAGQPVRVGLRSLPARGSAPRVVVSGTGALLAALAAVFLLAPFGRDRGALSEESADPLRVERNALYAALRDLEHDHETGKVSDADFATLRGDIRRRVAALFEREDAGTTPDSVTLPEIIACPSCSAPVRPGDRFCAQCGASLEAKA